MYERPHLNIRENSKINITLNDLPDGKDELGRLVSSLFSIGYKS